MNSTSNLEDLKNSEVEFETAGDSYEEELLRAIVLSYQQAYNKNNPKNDIKFTVTVTQHKINTQDGNKHCAYLRLDRSIREKNFKEQEVEKDGVKVLDDGWEGKLLHQEVYFFRDIKERLNPESPWKQQLFVNCIARLMGAGLEYAELLQRIKPAQETAKQATTVEERLNDIGLVSADSIPTPLDKVDLEYKEWLAQERAKEGL